MRYRRSTTRYVRLAPIRDASRYGDVFRTFVPVVSVARLRWRPPADICETPRSVVVVLEVAGLDEDDIDVGLYEDALVIEGERRVDMCGEDGFYHAAEIRQGPFHVEVSIPVPIDPDGVEATYEGGLLRVELPKATRAAEPHTDEAAG
jgi:HSP20 family protein